MAAHGRKSNYEVVLGTRKSKLAVIQCNLVSHALRSSFPALLCSTQTVVVRGDADKRSPFLLMNERQDIARQDNLAKSLWTEEMELQLLGGSLDILVHSLKDLATSLSDGTSIGAFVSREDPRDAIVTRDGMEYTTLEQLPAGSRVGTSSTRRKALLHRLHPHLVVDERRGNV